jgi:YD repeat-containing protein
MNLNLMFSKTRSFLVFAAYALVLGTSGCASITQSVTQLVSDPVQTNVLSGREGENGPVLVVKIDDTSNARPQVGLEYADVVYIEQVEGGLTRLAAVFSSSIPPRIGPVRSARISDIELLAQYGHVAFAFSGAQKKLLPVIAAAKLSDVGAMRRGPTFYVTDPNRNQPYAMFLNAQTLMANEVSKATVIDPAKNVGWTFSEKLENSGFEITNATMNWPAQKYSARWDMTSNRWLLSVNSIPDLSDLGKNLGPTTLVIQMVSITPSEYGDKFGGNTPFSQTVGTGKAYVLRDGTVIQGTWNRADALSATTWTDGKGAEIKFAPGQVWVALTDKEPEFTRKIASAPSPTSK